MKMLIGGKEVNAKDGKTTEIINPATMEVVDTVPVATFEDVEEAVNIAKRGKEIWKAVPMHERVRILQKFTVLLERDREEFKELLCNETGKTMYLCESEVNSCINVFKSYCEKARVYSTETLPLDTEPGNTGDIIFTVREPLGIVACIVPFNYPTELYAHKVAPALVTGNAVIVKPSSDTPLGNLYLTKLLLEAGVPGEAVQVVTGSGAKIGVQLAQHKEIAAVTLTGSTAVGIDTAVNGAKTLKKVYLELGGNDPMILFDDANLEQAVSEAILGRAWNAGQTCCATKRLLVQKGVVEQFTEKLVGALKNIKVGDPHDPEVSFGPLINERAAMDVEKEIAHTVEQGAKCVLGGKRYNHTFIEPTVLTGVTRDMDVARELEIFGPVFPIIAFDTLEEAVEIANQIPYGLSSGVMTEDIRKALKVAMAMEAGTCVINGCGNYRTAFHAFGGYKMTGIGREGCGYTLDEFTQVKSIVMKQMIK